MSKIFSLKDISKITGIPEASLRRRIGEGGLSAIKVPKKNRQVWGITEETLQLLKQEQPESNLGKLVADWLLEQKNGIHTGKPLNSNTLRNNKTGLENYWKFLNLKPRLQDLTPDNLAKCFAEVGIDEVNKQCHYSTKHQILKAVCSFYKFLIRRGFRTETDLDTIKRKAPKRVYPARKTVLQSNQLTALLECNETLIQGRSNFDVQYMKTMLLLLAYAGLRRNELVNLKLNEVDLTNGIIHIIDGKGHKNRLVGIAPHLEKQLKLWLEEYRPDSSAKEFLVQETGQ